MRMTNVRTGNQLYLFLTEFSPYVLCLHRYRYRGYPKQVPMFVAKEKRKKNMSLLKFTFF